MNSEYSIVVPFHSNISLLHCCVKSLRDSAPDDIEIIIVANNRNQNELNTNLSVGNLTVLKFNEALISPTPANTGAESAQGRRVWLFYADTCCTVVWV